MTLHIEKQFTQPQMDMFQMRQLRVPNALFVGGYGCGKSEILVDNVIRDVLLFRGCKVAVYAPTVDLLTLNVLPRIEIGLLSLGLKFKLNKQQKIIYLQGDRQIIFRSMNDPSKIVAYECYASHIDELDLMVTVAKADDAWSRMLGRNRQVWRLPNGQAHPDHFNMMSGYTTPEGYKFCYERWVKKPGQGYKYVTAPTRSNWTLDQAFIDNLLDSYTPEQCEAYLEGRFTNIFSGTVYSYFDRKRHNTDRVLLPKEPIMCGCDFNYGGSCGSIYVPKVEAIKKDKRVITTAAELEELKIRKNNDTGGHVIGLDLVEEFSVQDTEQMIEKLLTDYAGRPITMFPDASGSANATNASISDIAMLKQAGLDVNAKRKNPRIVDRINSVQRMLYKDLFGINVENCPATTSAMEEQAYNSITNLPDKFPGAATIDDRNDAMGYCPANLYPIRKAGSSFTKKTEGF